MKEIFGTLPANSTAYWKSGPTERGTFGILSTCVLTLLLCVYTCLHPNIPIYGVTKWYQRPWALKAFGIVVGLFAPELVAYLAFRQWLCARNLESAMMKRMRKLLPPAPKRRIWSKFHVPADDEHTVKSATVHDVPIRNQRTSILKTNPWTRTHSHFALMGGFAFDVDNTKANFIPGSQTRLTLTPYALRKLAKVEPMLIPDISERAIKDKSKASGLAKILVCLQACWFIAQTIGRSATSTPISLLEMNTFLHALCCLVIYLAWWHKPLDINEPEVIKVSTEHTRRIFACMIMQSSWGACRVRDQGKNAFLVHKKDLFMKNTHEATSFRFSPDETSSYDDDQPDGRSKISGSTSLETLPDMVIHGFYLVRDKEANRIDPPRRPTLDPALLECLRLADLLRTDPGSDGLWKLYWPVNRAWPISAEMVLTHTSNFDLKDVTLERFRGSTILTRKLPAGPIFVMMMLLAGSIYGLVHLTAWNGPFPSLTQRLMWRVSCIIAASPGVVDSVEFISSLPGYLVSDGNYWLFRVLAPLWLPSAAIEFIRGFFFSSDTVRGKIMIGLSGLVYLAARVFLIAECFISISQLPPEVYQVPQWSQYIPHLGGG